eukprot:6775628-Prymnesium_polylepis.1
MEEPLITSDSATAPQRATEPPEAQSRPQPPLAERPEPPRNALTQRVFLLLMAVTFLDAVEYGVVMPSLYQYLVQIEGDGDGSGTANNSNLQAIYGIALGSFSFASMCCKPWLGAWCDRRTFREVYVATYCVAVAGNVVYALAGWWGSWHYVLLGRLLSGVGCANSALSYAYVSRTVDASMRTPYMSKLALAFPLGLLTGPAFNAITSQCDTNFGSFHLDDRNAPGVLLALLQLALLAALLCNLSEPPAYSAEATAAAEKQGWLYSLLAALCQREVAACFLVTFTFNLVRSRRGSNRAPDCLAHAEELDPPPQSRAPDNSSGRPSRSLALVRTARPMVRRSSHH